MNNDVIDLVSLPDAEAREEGNNNEVVDLISVDGTEDDIMEDGNLNPDQREYEFTIHGSPKTWKRPKTHVSINRAVGAAVRYFKNTVNPNKETVKQIKDQLNASLRNDYDLTDQDLEEPVYNGGILVVEIEFYRKPSLDYFIGKKRENGLKPEFDCGMNWPDSMKPDVDNLAKLVLDAMEGIIYGDDMKVTKLICTKLIDLTYPYEGRTMIWVKRCCHSDLPKRIGDVYPNVSGLARRHIAPWR